MAANWPTAVIRRGVGSSERQHLSRRSPSRPSRLGAPFPPRPPSRPALSRPPARSPRTAVRTSCALPYARSLRTAPRTAPAPLCALPGCNISPRPPHQLRVRAPRIPHLTRLSPRLCSCCLRILYSCVFLPSFEDWPPLEPGIGAGLNTAVERYYDITLDLYEDLWGEHVHHGFWDPGEIPGVNGADRHAATDRLVRELVEFTGVPPESTVLDVGCGIGGPALHLAGAMGCTVEGVTLSARQAARATQKARDAGLAGRARFHQLDALSTGFPDASFDVVWALESVMHLPDRAAFFAEAMRLLRPGGTLAVATWSVRDGELDDGELDLVRQILQHQVMPHFSSLEEHGRLARAAGFEDVAIVDWSKAVANSWDPSFAQIERFDRGRTLMRQLARERGVDVLGFFHAGPLMLRGFETGVITYGALRATRPATGPATEEAAGLVRPVAELLREVLDEDGAWLDAVTPGTRVDSGLLVESQELAAWSTALRDRYGDRVDLAGHVARLGIDEIIALTVGDVAAYVAARRDGAGGRQRSAEDG
ncbi:MAG: methyltransferase domain-containing protein [Streptomyces sp.]|nr:methyltransferase domain-containing protein [Streptomyces sp.]